MSPTLRATFTIGDEMTARGVVDRLSESFDDGETAIAAFERLDACWDVSIHFLHAPDQTAVAELIAQAAGPSAAKSLVFETVEATDWVRSSLEGLPPVHAGRFVVHGRHDRGAVSANKLGIEIEAALAFGTGHHGTTRGCLLMLDRVLRARRPRRVLDLGSGTGVLGIAAAKASRQPVLCSDIDPLAAAVARENARANGVGQLVTSVRAVGFSSVEVTARAPFDLILANILANPLRSLANAMSRNIRPGGLVILSGLLPHQAKGVVSAYRCNGVVLLRHVRLDGWSSLLMRRV